jgi:steroid delta-isomerase-like uncharacterized protein
MSNRSIAESYFQAVTRGDIEGALATFAPGAEFVEPSGGVPFPDGVRAMLAGYDGAFPGSRFEIKLVVETGADVAVEGVWVGKHTGPMHLPDGRKIPATNKEVRAPFVTMFRVRDGKLASHRAYWDMAGMMAQLTG